jgi:predicted glycosyltransferase
MSIVCVFRELESAHDQRVSGDEVVEDVVEELTERLRVMLHMKEDQDAKNDKRQEREVG